MLDEHQDRTSTKTSQAQRTEAFGVCAESIYNQWPGYGSQLERSSSLYRLRDPVAHSLEEFDLLRERPQSPRPQRTTDTHQSLPWICQKLFFKIRSRAESHNSDFTILALVRTLLANGYCATLSCDALLL